MGPLKVRENTSFLSAMLRQGLPSVKLQGPKTLQVTHLYKGTREDTHACVHAVFPLGCTPAVRLTKVDPGLHFTWNKELPFLSNPYILPLNFHTGSDSLVLCGNSIILTVCN